MNTLKKKIVYSAILLIAGLTLSSGSVFAATWLGNFSGKDPFPKPLNVLNINSPALEKIKAADINSGSTSSVFTATYDKNSNGKDNKKSGTWTFNPTNVTGANPVLYPEYMVVKGGNGYTVWELGQSDLLSGTWSTEHLLNNSGKQPNVSHISFYGSRAAVPLPAAAWLFGSALLGMIGVGSRRRIKVV